MPKMMKGNMSMNMMKDKMPMKSGMQMNMMTDSVAKMNRVKASKMNMGGSSTMTMDMMGKMKMA